METAKTFNFDDVPPLSDKARARFAAGKDTAKDRMELSRIMLIATVSKSRAQGGRWTDDDLRNRVQTR